MIRSAQASPEIQPASRWEPPNRSLPGRWLPPGILILTAAIMLAWTWGKWPDVLVDFGRELYVAGEITDGKVLYRDIAHIQGPLSPYVNALWFTFFGKSLRTLVFANLAILALTVALSYRLLREFANRFAATTACVLFLALFSFAQFSAIGNFNYICPYRHEVTHGMALALAALNCLAAYVRRPRPWLVAATGACLGLLALSKGEFFAALLLALLVSFTLLVWRERPSLHAVLRSAAIFALVAAIPILTSFALLASAMPASEAFRGLLGSWPATFNEAFGSSLFVQRGMGTDDVAANARAFLRWTVTYVAVFGIATLVSLLLRTRGWLRPATSAALVVLFVTLLNNTLVRWADVARPLPLVMLLVALATLAQCILKKTEPDAFQRLIPLLGLVIFAGVLLGKMVLNARIYHYGFVLAMPAVMLTVVMLLDWIPAWIEKRGGFGWTFRAIALTALFLTTQWYLSTAAVRLRLKTLKVGDGPNTFYAESKAAAVNEVLAKMGEPSATPGSLIVLPQGAMLNFLSGRPNPTPFVDFVPTEFFYHGESRIMAAVTNRPPDYFALAHCDTTEFGYRFFGQDYGQKLSGWIQSHYHEVLLAGDRPFAAGKFGILLLRRNE